MKTRSNLNRPPAQLCPFIADSNSETTGPSTRDKGSRACNLPRRFWTLACLILLSYFCGCRNSLKLHVVVLASNSGISYSCDLVEVGSKSARSEEHTSELQS